MIAGESLPLIIRARQEQQIEITLIDLPGRDGLPGSKIRFLKNYLSKRIKAGTHEIYGRFYLYYDNYNINYHNINEIPVRFSVRTTLFAAGSGCGSPSYPILPLFFLSYP